MAKIYNEIVIDMNPESPTFEETLYEDSFEYSGDIIHLYGDNEQSVYIDLGFDDAHNADMVQRWYIQADGSWVKDISNIRKSSLSPSDVIVETAPIQGQQAAGDQSYESIITTAVDAFVRTEIGDIDLTGLSEWEAIQRIAKLKYNTVSGDELAQQGLSWDQLRDELYATGWSKYDPSDPGTEGLPPMTNERWNEMDLNAKAQYILDTKYGGDVPEEEYDLEFLKDQIMTTQPLKGDIDPTKAGFLSEQYGGGNAQFDYNNDGTIDVNDAILAPEDQKQTISDLITSGDTKVTTFAESLAGQTAGQTLGTSLGTLQSTAEGLPSAYGGRGVGMRERIGGKKKLKSGLETAYAGYGLAESQADIDYRKGIYGLEEDVEGKWETDWSTFWGSLPEAGGG